MACAPRAEAAQRGAAHGSAWRRRRLFQEVSFRGLTTNMKISNCNLCQEHTSSNPYKTKSKSGLRCEEEFRLEAESLVFEAEFLVFEAEFQVFEAEFLVFEAEFLSGAVKTGAVSRRHNPR